MLSAIAVFAVVGATLAFKAQNQNLRVTYAYCNTIANTCTTAFVQGTNISSVRAINRNVSVTSATLDQFIGFDQACNDANHPCTATVYYQTTINP